MFVVVALIKLDKTRLAVLIVKSPSSVNRVVSRYVELGVLTCLALSCAIFRGPNGTKGSISNAVYEDITQI